ncbi:dihydrofolate reductase [Chelatococcus daeguensis]|uniref:dihydrofolate reductase family protein n=1 Tax=Chelatococcus daeguensis TaxID=444444 RepID=UPI0007ABAF94|nr:dihydrofolate reductase family protein [Chelatococcus daeguensis]KZE28296.1 riboflavin biosynthesis protein RibD [Chelatococcus daeguensis]MBM3084339.1 dihydrofolate reductase [Chelatococcus daeguensis]
MRRIIATAYVSLDGVMQAPGGPEEDTTGGFALGGWLVPYWDDMMNKRIIDSMAEPFDLLLGRRTYEIFAAYWPHAGDNPIANRFNAATKYVATRSLDHLDWAGSIRIGGDVAAEITRLKSGDGPDIQTWGSSDLLQTLTTAGLIDEYRVWIFPLILGRGKRLFEDGLPARALALADTTTSSTGVVISTYRPAGEVKPGSFVADAPSDAELARRRKLADEARAS